MLCPSRWAPGWRLHTEISINLGKTFLWISRTRNILMTWILAWNLVYLPDFISQIPEFIYRTVLIFILIYYEWRDTENQQLTISSCVSVRMSRYWARGKFGEHERGVRVARGAAECNSSLLIALQTSQVLIISTYAQLQHELIVL